MAADTAYDPSLTARIRAELEEMGAPTSGEDSELHRLVDRFEGELRGLATDPERRERTRAFLRGTSETSGPGAGWKPGTPRPVRRTLGEMVDMSARLDSTVDPSEGFGLAEGVARRAHELSHTIQGFFPALDPADAISTGFEHLLALLGRLIRNAVAKLRSFGQLLGISSFSIAFASLPPEVTVTFNFG